MPDLTADARQLHAKLLKKYLAALPGKRSRIAGLKRELMADGWRQDALSQFKVEVHRLAGSAGSYGLAALGDVALRLDGALTTGTDTVDQRAQVIALADDLLRAFDVAIDPPGVGQPPG